jgi:hypothetical protein
MSRPESVCVFGGGIAALVTSDVLAGAGYRVCLWNSAKSWGGHFGGMEVAGHKFDIGMNLLEFTSLAPQSSDVSSYDALVRNDCGRFVAEIATYVRSLVECTTVDAPSCMYGGSVAPDIIVANRLDILRTLPAELRERAAGELQRAVGAQGPLHARNKARFAETFELSSLAEASLANHGETLHEILVETLCRKALGIPSSELSALHHRAAWTPLYYPETLLSGLQGSISEVAPTEFSYPTSGSFRSIVEALVSRVERHDATIRRDALQSVQQQSTGGYLLNGADEFDHLVWSGTPEALGAAMALQLDETPARKGGPRLTLVTTPSSNMKQAFSAIFVLDAKSPIYRVSDQTACAKSGGELSILTVESEAPASIGATAAPMASTIDELERLGIVKSAGAVAIHRDQSFREAVTIPTLETIAASRRRLSALRDHAPDIVLIGSAAPIGATSFNDSVIQGLAAAHALSP